MASSRSDGPPRRRPPAQTAEAQEQLMVSLAFSQAQKQLEDGNAPTQVVTHFLKIGALQHQLELENLRKDNLLRQARVDQIAASSNNGELYQKAIDAMMEYTGEVGDDNIDFA